MHIKSSSWYHFYVKTHHFDNQNQYQTVYVFIQNWLTPFTYLKQNEEQCFI